MFLVLLACSSPQPVVTTNDTASFTPFSAAAAGTEHRQTQVSSVRPRPDTASFAPRPDTASVQPKERKAAR